MQYFYVTIKITSLTVLSLQFSKLLISIFTLSIFYLSSLTLHSQLDTLNVIPQYTEGQKFVLQVTETSRSFKNKKIDSESTNEYGIKITILQQSQNGYLVRFDLRDFLFFSEDPDMFEQINHLDKGLVIELNLDQDGMLESISNWEILRDQAHKMLDDIRITLGYNEQLVANFDTLKGVFSQESKLRDHFVEEGQLWLLANGMYFEKGEVFKTEALMPVLFSNDSIPTEVSIGLKKIENNIAHVFYLQTFSRSDVKDFIVDEISFFTGFDLEVIQELGSFDFFMEYESDLKINIDSKICEEFIHRRVIKIDDYKNITRTRGILKEIR